MTSHTADPSALTGYGPLSDLAGRRFTLRWIGEGIAEISEIVDGKPVKIADRTAAERLTNTKLFITRDRLPVPEDDEYYLADLIGLVAISADGTPLGIVSVVHDYGAGVSLEIAQDQAGSLLVPFTAECVPEVDVASGRVVVALPDEVDVPETGSPGHGPVEPHRHRDKPEGGKRLPFPSSPGFTRGAIAARCAADSQVKPGDDAERGKPSLPVANVCAVRPGHVGHTGDDDDTVHAHKSRREAAA